MIHLDGAREGCQKVWPGQGSPHYPVEPGDPRGSCHGAAWNRLILNSVRAYVNPGRRCLGDASGRSPMREGRSVPLERRARQRSGYDVWPASVASFVANRRTASIGGTKE